MEEAVIQTKNLAIGYGKKVLYKGLNLCLASGQLTCLLGLNGAGKSTLLRTLSGFQPPLGGELLLQGKALTAYSSAELALRIGLVLTEKIQVGDLSAYEMVALGRHPYTGFFGRLKAQDREAITRALKAVGMESRAKQSVAEMSDGERQKIMIAKALAQECPIILLDEPTAFLDVASRIETMALLRRLVRGQGKAVLLSTHDMDLAIQMADRLWLLKPGKGMASGSPEDLILDGKLGALFEEESLHFDPMSGKLNRAIPSQPIGLEGDALSVRWVSNALLRNGYQPTGISSAYPCIRCLSPTKLFLRLPGKEEEETSSVESLLQALRD
jgi:iron complex transport system ATP-binding protein